MKDGRTHLAYKAEHVVDLESDVQLTAEILPATAADTETLVDSVLQAQVHPQAAGSEQQIEEVAADKGYHAAATLELATDLKLRTYIPEPSALTSSVGPTSRLNTTPRWSTTCVAYAARRINSCSGCGVNAVSGASRTSATQAACGGPGCTAWSTPANAMRLLPRPTT